KPPIPQLPRRRDVSWIVLLLLSPSHTSTEWDDYFPLWLLRSAETVASVRAFRPLARTSLTLPGGSPIVFATAFSADAMLASSLSSRYRFGVSLRCLAMTKLHSGVSRPMTV